MLAIFRKGRIYWILGVALLIGSLVGSRWLVNASSANDGSAPPKTTGTGEGVINVGFVDQEDGIRNLSAVQPGRVMEVWIKEGDEVAEGDLLFRLDDTMARLKLQEARADLVDAEKQLAQAKLLDKQLGEKVAQQSSAIEAQQRTADAMRKDLEQKSRIFKLGQMSPEEFGVFQQKLKAQEAVIEVEKAKLRELNLVDNALMVDRAQAKVSAKQNQVELARQALLECDVYAPTAGSILRLFVHAGEMTGVDYRVPALQFCPKGPRIIRAEVLQEWAGRVKVGQTVTIEDDTRAGIQWRGTVKRVSDWFTHRRNILQEPSQFNDVRTLECLVAIEPGGPPLRIGQRVRVIVK